MEPSGYLDALFMPDFHLVGSLPQAAAGDAGVLAQDMISAPSRDDAYQLHCNMESSSSVLYGIKTKGCDAHAACQRDLTSTSAS